MYMDNAKSIAMINNYYQHLNDQPVRYKIIPAKKPFHIFDKVFIFTATGMIIAVTGIYVSRYLKS